MKNFRPLILFVLFVLVVGLACNATSNDGGDTPQDEPQPATQVEESQPEPEATATQPPPEPTNTPRPTATEEPQVQKYFREEFEDSYVEDNWSHFTVGSGSDSNLVIKQEDDHLLVDVGDEDLYIYYMYLGEVYDDVALTMNAENRGRNNNNVSLVCRMSEDGETWYEFSVLSGGLWYLYAYQDGYNLIDNGGTNALKQGKEVNEYGMTCEGNEITMTVNGKEIKTYKDNTYAFNEGLIGFNISSLNVLPITVEVNWLEIAEP